ncbi:MAG: ATP-binding cassette domain-containing protein, partial [Clostridia bacterium]|nr:ATP-binding cassette domain-containing protein [Clostridia bacterium]
MNEKILEVRDIKKYFPIKGGFLQKTVANVKAVDGVSFDVLRGETIGLVGESGCGKSTLGRTIVRLYEPTEGEIIFNGKDISGLRGNDLKHLRQQMQLIFQDPYSSLNPRINVMNLVGEAMIAHGLAKKGQDLADKVT